MHWVKMAAIVTGFILFLMGLYNWLECDTEEEEEKDRLPLDNFNRWEGEDENDRE